MCLHVTRILPRPTHSPFKSAMESLFEPFMSYLPPMQSITEKLNVPLSRTTSPPRPSNTSRLTKSPPRQDLNELYMLWASDLAAPAASASSPTQTITEKLNAQSSCTPNPSITSQLTKPSPRQDLNELYMLWASDLAASTTSSSPATQPHSCDSDSSLAPVQTEKECDSRRDSCQLLSSQP